MEWSSSLRNSSTTTDESLNLDLLIRDELDNLDLLKFTSGIFDFNAIAYEDEATGKENNFKISDTFGREWKKNLSNLKSTACLACLVGNLRFHMSKLIYLYMLYLRVIKLYLD